MALTDIGVKNLKPREKPYKISDGRGMHLLINPSGSKLWQFRYRFDDKQKMISLGPYPEVGLSKARKRREEARALIVDGIDPSEARKAAKEERRAELEGTFAKVADAYIVKLGKDGRKEETIQKNRWLLGIASADFGEVPMRQISASMILKTLERIQDAGTIEKAHRLRTTIGSVFRYAVARDLADTDPTYALRGALAQKQVKHHAAIVDKSEFLKLMDAIEHFNGQATTKLALKLLALLVPRPGELRAARWEEFDLTEKVWVIPAERMKMKREHHIPLAPQAITLLGELRELTGWGELLFPSQMSSKRSMSENTLNTALRRMGYTGDEMTSHGFRSSFSTIANESGLWNADAIEKALAHEERNQVRRAYARGKYWEERVKLANWWAAEII